MKPSKLFRRWREQQVILLADLQQHLRRVRRTGQPEEVHQLRVVARRLRLLIRLGAAWYDEDTVSRFREWSQKLSVATDPLRDLDVAIEWVAARTPPAPTTIAELQRQRDQLWRQSRQQLPPFLQRLLPALAAPEGGRKHELRLHRRCARFTRTLRSRSEKNAPRFFELDLPNQHDFRRLVRRWRYLRELELPERRHRKDPTLRQLLRLQDALGTRQNLLLARDVLRHLPRNAETRKLRRPLQAEILLVEQEIHKRLAAVFDSENT